MTKSISNYKKSKDYIGKISIKKNEEYIWNYNNYFEKNKFTKPYDSLDWIVIGPTQFYSNNSTSRRNSNKNSYKLSEGDFIKLGKITFLVRKIKDSSNEKIKEKKINHESNHSISINNSNSNMNLNMNNIINEELEIIYRNNIDINYTNTNNELLQTLKTTNEDKTIINNEISNSINNKLKVIYTKLKNINEKQKLVHYKCRICFCDGSFEGNDPLISPCKCTGSVTYIHLSCLRRWLTSKISTKVSPSNNIYCYTFKSFECEICKSTIPEIVEYRGKFISLLNFRDIKPPYIILQTMYQYNAQNKNTPDYHAIFVISLKEKDYLILGRANNSDIRLSDVSVSRNHSIISYSNGNFYIDDIASKFGTLVLIQNNIVFLPYKELNMQTGRCHFIFRLVRTFMGCFKCIKNKIYDKLSYEDYCRTKDKKVYWKILETFNNNIVDPIEKFNSMYGSESVSENNSINEVTDNGKNNEENSKIKESNNEDDEKTEKLHTIIKDENENNNVKYIFENSIRGDQRENIEEYDINENPNIYEMNIRSIEKKPTINLNINNEINQIRDNENKLILTKSMFKNKINNSNKNEVNKNNLIVKQNESNEILFHDIKSASNNNINGLKINNTHFSFLNIMNLFKKNQKSMISLNIKFNDNLNQQKKDNIALANTQREKSNLTKKFE